MKLYDTPKAPNPRRVRIFLAEKGVPPPERVEVDLGRADHKGDDFRALNPWTRTPLLVLDDGTAIAESVAICRYFEELHPEPALFGTGAKERALVEMWNRRLELGLMLSAAAAFRHLHPFMAEMEVPQVAAWGEANKPKVIEQMRLIDDSLADGRSFLAGEAFSVADITGGVALEFARVSRLAVPGELGHLRAWHARLAARPSWVG